MILSLWKEAYQKMPNNVRVKEFLMSTYFDADKVKYSQEIIELGMEIYNSDANMYYKGQAIREIAHTYAEMGDMVKAEQWVLKTVQIQHCQEVLFSEILVGDEMVDQIAFFTHWTMQELLYMARRIAFLTDDETTLSADNRIETLKTVANLYEILYRNDDMSFESLQLLYLTHMQITELESQGKNCEDVIRKHLERAFACASKATTITEHKLTHPLLFGWNIQDAPLLFGWNIQDAPLLFGWNIQDAPSDNRHILRCFQAELNKDYLNTYRNTPWLQELKQNCHKKLS